MKVNRVINGDAPVVLNSFEECSIDLAITSPPYDDLRNYEGYQFNAGSMMTSVYRVLKRGGVMVWVVGDRVKNGVKTLTSFSHAMTARDVGFGVHDVMIYQKSGTPFIRSTAYTNCFEYMFIFAKGKPKTFNPLKMPTKYSTKNTKVRLNRYRKSDGSDDKVECTVVPRLEKTRTNIWEYAVGLGGSTMDKIAFDHPAIFPEKLATDHILSWSNPGDIVIDPMCGSGTTLKSALLNNRNYIGIDISKKYCHISNERINIAKEQLKLVF